MLLFAQMIHRGHMLIVETQLLFISFCCMATWTREWSCRWALINHRNDIWLSNQLPHQLCHACMLTYVPTVICDLHVLVLISHKSCACWFSILSISCYMHWSNQPSFPWNLHMHTSEGEIGERGAVNFLQLPWGGGGLTTSPLTKKNLGIPIRCEWMSFGSSPNSEKANPHVHHSSCRSGHPPPHLPILRSATGAQVHIVCRHDIIGALASCFGY